MKVDNQLTNFRKQLDRVDAEILALLEKRLVIADKIGETKNRLGMPITDEQRELAITDNLAKRTSNQILKNSLASIFSPIFELSKANRIFSIQRSLAFKNVGIIGTGLIGGSIIKALKSRNPNITISALTHNYQELDKQYIDIKVQSISQLAVICDLIIVASPIDSIIPLTKEIALYEKIRSSKLIVMDCGSVKGKITTAFEALTGKNMEFIPTHPMAGSEKSGFNNAHPLLFLNQPWIITPHTNNTEPAINDIYQLIRYLGSNPVEMNAKDHDRKIALVSHLAFLISVMYFSFVKKTDRSSLRLAGPGFRSIARLAKGNALMHKQIFTNNRANIIKESKEFIRYFSSILSENANLETLFTSIKKQSEKFFK